MIKLLRGIACLALFGTTTFLSRVASAAPKTEKAWGLPFDASEHGHHIDWLIQITAVFTGILFIIMCIWMVWACFKHDEKHAAEYDHGDSQHSVKVALTLSAFIFLIVDGNLWVDSTLDVNGIFWNYAEADKKPEAVRIEVNAHQWAWDARYAGPDKKFNTPDDLVTLNDIRVPVDTPIILQLASVDVIHSFYLPNMRIKQDAVPGAINPMWFHPKVVGEYDIACAQHCGPNHYKMRGVLTVMPKKDFERWLAHGSALSAKAYNPDDPSSHWGWEWKELD